MIIASLEVTPDSVVAYGTAALALFTAGLAWSTRRLANAANRDQRAQWRPVLIADDPEVDETVVGELRIRVRNVGRGPALGIHGQLRISGPSGATIPGLPDVAPAGETLDLRFTVKGEHPRAAIRKFEVSYYDIGEWWHQTELTATLREQPDRRKRLHISKTFVNESGRQLLPVLGSPRAVKEAERERRRPWLRSWRWLHRKSGHGR